MDAPRLAACRQANPALSDASMSAPARSLKLDIAALALFAGVVFYGLALATYDPADPVGELLWPASLLYTPDVSVYPQTIEVTNACGRLGAALADISYVGLGWGVWYLLLSLAGVDALLLMRREIDTPALRLAGWLLTLAATTTFLTIFAAEWGPGPVIGAGGFLGALCFAGLSTHFAIVGSVILAGAVLAAGVLLATDYVVFTATLAMIKSLGGAVLSAGAFVLARRPRSLPRLPRLRSRTDGAFPPPVGAGSGVGDDAPVSIRIHGRDVESLDDAWNEDEDAGEFDESDDMEEAASGGFFSRLRRRFTSNGVAGAHPADHEIDDDDDGVERSLEEELDEAAESPLTDYELPTLDILLDRADVRHDVQEKDARRKAKILEKTFQDFGFNVRVVGIETGPVIGMYEVELEAGLRLSKITSLADDLAIALRVPSVRIVAPIPGKNTVGIEIPNKERQLVRLREIIEESEDRAAKMKIPIFLGRDVSGGPLAVDLASLPHLLIAGRTGTGKSVCLNAIISSILMTRRPDEVRLLMIDPKMVELSGYKTLPHLMHPVVTDMKRAEAILAWAVEKMEQRYELLAKAGVRHVTSYNKLSEEELLRRIQPEDDEAVSIPRNLPFIVIVADEMADLMMTAGKDVEQHIIRLAQKSRAVGIHLILATQKPTVDVITGLIKSNLPARIAFQVASRTDSRVVLDEMGADKLLGNGDLLFLWPGTSNLLRGQGAYLSDDEINAIVGACSTGEQHFVHELVNLKVDDEQETPQPGGLKKRDDLYEAAVDVVVHEGRGSVSLIQRALAIGYGRAARMIDFMAEDGIVGQYNGSNAREVLISVSEWEAMQGAEAMQEAGGDEEAPAAETESGDWSLEATGTGSATVRKPTRKSVTPSKLRTVESPASSLQTPNSKRLDAAEEPGPAKKPRRIGRIVPTRDERNEIDEDISDVIAPRPSIFAGGEDEEEKPVVTETAATTGDEETDKSRKEETSDPNLQSPVSVEEAEEEWEEDGTEGASEDADETEPEWDEASDEDEEWGDEEWEEEDEEESLEEEKYQYEESA